MEVTQKGQDKRSYSALAPQTTQNPQTPSYQHYPQTYPQAGGHRARPGFQTPQTPKLHKQMSMKSWFQSPGVAGLQVMLEFGHKKRAIKSPFVEVN